MDKGAHTRTIIHTPGEELKENSIDISILDGGNLLYLDGRHAYAALQVPFLPFFHVLTPEAATWATEKKIPIVFDLEREHGMETCTVPKLLELASVVVMSRYQSHASFVDM